MPLVRDGQIIDDSFMQILDETPIADSIAVIVPAARLLAEAENLAGRSGQTGVIWPNNRPVDELAPNLDRLSLIALVFPTFRDGRAYSQARILRERYRFRGELRATGQILRDQFLFLQRAGFDTFDVVKETDARAFAETVNRFSVVYQPAADGRTIALRRRLAQAHEIATATATEPVSCS